MPKLAAANFLQADHAYARYVAQLDEGTKFEDVLDPAFWAHIANRLRPLSQIEIFPHDNSFYARLIVLDADRLWARVAVLEKKDLVPAGASTAEIAMPQGFTVDWGGPVHKFRVRRGADILSKDHATKADAREWIARNAQSAAA